MPDTIDILTRARAYLVKYGWRQYAAGEIPETSSRNRRVGACCCAVEAIWFVQREPFPGESSPRNLLKAALALYDRGIELAKKEAVDG